MKRSLLVLSLALTAGQVFAQAENPPAQRPIGGQPPHPLTEPAFQQPQAHTEPAFQPHPFFNLTVLSETAAAIPFNIPINSSFEISLPDNSGSTGYVWTWTDDSTASIVQHIGDGTYTHDNLSGDNNRVGSPTTCNFWRFKTVTPGQTVLTFSLTRPWEKCVAPIQQISFTIVAQANDNIPQPPSAQ